MIQTLFQAHASDEALRVAKDQHEVAMVKTRTSHAEEMEESAEARTVMYSV